MLKRIVKTVIDFLLEVLFPEDPLVNEIKKRDELGEQVFEKAGKAEETWIRPLFNYRDPYTAKAIWELKYKGNVAIARVFAKQLNDSILEDLGDDSLLSNFTNPIIIPAPLSKKRELERGFNQTKLVLLEFQKLKSGIKISNTALKKIKHTKPQTTFSKKSERLGNLFGAFEATAPEISGQNIIIFDDVTTTGATLREIRKTLLSAGAKKVIAYTLAH